MSWIDAAVAISFVPPSDTARSLFFRFSDSLTFSRVEDTGIDIAQERGIAGGLDTGGMVTRSTKRGGTIVAWELSFSFRIVQMLPHYRQKRSE